MEALCRGESQPLHRATNHSVFAGITQFFPPNYGSTFFLHEILFLVAQGWQLCLHVKNPLHYSYKSRGKLWCSGSPAHPESAAIPGGEPRGLQWFEFAFLSLPDAGDTKYLIIMIICTEEKYPDNLFFLVLWRFVDYWSKLDRKGRQSQLEYGRTYRYLINAQ